MAHQLLNVEHAGNPRLDLVLCGIVCVGCVVWEGVCVVWEGVCVVWDGVCGKGGCV